MRKLKRYRINNCADIQDDNGGYCLSEDVERLESRLKIDQRKNVVLTALADYVFALSKNQVGLVYEVDTEYAEEAYQLLSGGQITETKG